MYQYNAQYISNYDGDTVKFIVDLGFGITYKITVRVSGINTPELRTKDPVEKAKAYEAKEFVREALLGADKLVVKTFKDKKGKYGRYIADIFYDGVNLGEELIGKELAVIYK